MKIPDKDKKFPLENYNRLCFLKNVVNDPNIIIGDYTYYDDFETVDNFEKNVKYLFDFTGDKLRIGKFCMIASDVTFHNMCMASIAGSGYAKNPSRPPTTAYAPTL